MPSNSAWSSCALATQSCCRCRALLRDERPALGSYMSGTVPEQDAARTGKVTMHFLVSGSLLRLNRSSEEVVRNRPEGFFVGVCGVGKEVGNSPSASRAAAVSAIVMVRSSRGSRHSEPVVQRVLFDDCKDQVHKSILSDSEAELWSERWPCEAGDQARQDQTLVTDHCTAFPPGVCTSVDLQI